MWRGNLGILGDTEGTIEKLRKIFTNSDIILLQLFIYNLKISPLSLVTDFMGSMNSTIYIKKEIKKKLTNLTNSVNLTISIKKEIEGKL